MPPDSVRCTRRLQAKLFTFGNSLRYNSLDCPVYTGQCPVLQGRGILNSPASGIRSAIIHRTCPVCTGLSGEPAEQRLLRANGHLQAHLMGARSAQKSGTRALAHRTLYSTCLVCHRTSRRAQKTELQRSEPNGLGDVAGAPDMSGVHQTVRCTMRQGMRYETSSNYSNPRRKCKNTKGF